MIQCQYVTVTNLPGTVDHRWHGVVNRYGPQTGWCRCVVRFGQMKRPRRGRRNRIHRFRVHQRPRHRPARRAARQGRPLPRRPVPTLALSPVLHQHRPTGTRGRHHPPPTRDPRTVFADLIDGPLAHLPSGRFGANSAWILCAAIAHNLLRAAGVLAGDQHARARGSLAPAHSLALVETLAPAVAQHDRIQPTNHDLTPTTRRTRPYRHHKCSGAASCPARPGIELARFACVGTHGPLSPLGVGQGRRLLEV